MLSSYECTCAAAAALGMLDIDPTTPPTGAKPQACVTTTSPVRIFKENIFSLLYVTAQLLLCEVHRGH